MGGWEVGPTAPGSHSARLASAVKRESPCVALLATAPGDSPFGPSAGQVPTLELVTGPGDMVFLLASAGPGVALAPPKALGPRVAGRWCPTGKLSPVTRRGQKRL